MSKIKTLMKVLKESNKHMKNWGGKYAISYFNRNLIKSTEDKNRRLALSLMDKKYSYIFDKYKNTEYHISTEVNNNIFIYWANGFDNAPELVKICVSQVKKLYSDSYNIHLIDDNNIKDYVTLNSRILNYYKNKKITIQTFSDILRFNLLYKYGGCWFDSTLLMLEKFPLKEMILKYGYYSLNHECDFFKNVYDVTWTSYFQCSDQGNPNMGACVEYYNEYYKTHDYAIDYFMSDYMLCLCSKYGIANDQLKNISPCKYNPFSLNDYIIGNKSSYENYTKCPQKLSWRYNEEQIVKLKEVLGL